MANDNSDFTSITPMSQSEVEEILKAPAASQQSAEIINPASAPATETNEQTDSASEGSNQAEPPAVEKSISDEESTKYFQDLTKGEFKDVYALVNEYERLKKVSLEAKDPMEGLSDFSKNIIKWEKEGLDPRQFAEQQSLNFQKMDAKGIFKHDYLIKNPGAAKSNPEQANRLAEMEFKILSRNLSDDSIDDEMRQYYQDKLDLETEKKRKELIDWQQKNSVPQKQENAAPQVNKEFVQNHLRTVDSTFSQMKHLDIQVGDAKSADDFKYAPTPQLLSKAKEFVSDPDAFIRAAFEDQNGNIDYSKASKIAMIVADPDGYSKSLVKHGMSLGAEKLITGKKNVAKPGNNSNEGQQVNIKSEMAQLADQFFQS
jgi:hypothetical protein